MPFWKLAVAKYGYTGNPHRFIGGVTGVLVTGFRGLNAHEFPASVLLRVISLQLHA